MTRIAAICIHNNLTPSQAGIPVGAANYETSCGVDEELRLPIHHFLRQHGIKDIFSDVFMNLLLGYLRVMLSGQHHGL